MKTFKNEILFLILLLSIVAIFSEDEALLCNNSITRLKLKHTCKSMENKQITLLANRQANGNSICRHTGLCSLE